MAYKLKNKSVSQSIETLYLDAKLADVSFVFEIDGETHEVTAHKLILAAASPVFHRIFYGLMRESRYVKVSSATIDGFKEFLQFFYLKRVTISMEHIEEVINLAKKYHMFECINSCVRYIESKLTMENVCWGYQLAMSVDNVLLRQFCERMISTSPLDVFQTDSFLRCDRNILKNILLIDLMLCKETDVLNACLSWARSACKQNDLDENDPKCVKSQLGECFYLIRFDAMKTEELVGILAAHRDLFSSSELADISFMFSQNLRSKPLDYWPRNQELMCWRENSIEDTPYHIQSMESLWFTANKPLLFGAFWCKGLLNKYSHSFSVNFQLTIIEVDDESSESNTLFTKEVTLIRKIKTRIAIPQPLIILPHKVYEIRMETENCNYYYHCALWNSEVQLDDDLCVKFHQNDSIGNSNRRGLVSCLSFKRL
ncbi:BTB/POZ domain-containing protein 6-like [Sitodiplosis mosellana]|uniref:BTB/POZ domain-containing protein 6-like n=1 Tax=Sitodiplosis mosellana TaxID=263140 RepID=UPI0024444C84|nr:BTB/POZ domain-containing protein 6-like [Sitodiplosis mosellana]